MQTMTVKLFFLVFNSIVEQVTAVFVTPFVESRRVSAQMREEACGSPSAHCAETACLPSEEVRFQKTCTALKESFQPDFPSHVHFLFLN